MGIECMITMSFISRFTAGFGHIVNRLLIRAANYCQLLITTKVEGNFSGKNTVYTFII